MVAFKWQLWYTYTNTTALFPLALRQVKSSGLSESTCACGPGLGPLTSGGGLEAAAAAARNDSPGGLPVVQQTCSEVDWGRAEGASVGVPSGSTPRALVWKEAS